MFHSLILHLISILTIVPRISNSISKCHLPETEHNLQSSRKCLKPHMNQIFFFSSKAFIRRLPFACQVYSMRHIGHECCYQKQFAYESLLSILQVSKSHQNIMWSNLVVEHEIFFLTVPFYILCRQLLQKSILWMIFKKRVKMLISFHKLTLYVTK